MAEHDHRGRVADEDQLDARLVGEERRRCVVGGDHGDLLVAALHLADLGEREAFRAPGWPGRASAGGCSSWLSFQEDVVDQSRRADTGGDGKGWPVEVGQCDVLRLDSGFRQDPARPFRVSGRERAWDRDRPGTILGA